PAATPRPITLSEVPQRTCHTAHRHWGTEMDAKKAETLKTILRVTSGNFLEMFDFFLFGIYATHIAHTFFPNDNEFVSMMSTFLSFAAGFVMRPIGALVLGPYID